MYIIEKLHRADGVTTTDKIYTVSDEEAKKEINFLKKYLPITWDDRKAKGSIGFRKDETHLIVIYKVRE